MNKQEQRAVKRYLHDIKRTLPVYRKVERRFLSDIHSTIEEYAETGAVITSTTLRQEFGEPKDQVILYLSSKDGKDLEKDLSVSACIRYTAYIIIIAVITASFCFIYTTYKSYEHVLQADIAYTETVIGELPDCEWEDGNPPGDAVLPTEESTTTETTN
ncbi:hypothetical protein GT641_05925 [Clostridium sp. BIOML-A1]|jgi:hypothetical protein|uniref:DUF6120 family protein n=1 Tax=Clostridium sp. BIOML-A1 TaxID=2584627 RepID=UPI001369CA02|nr:DUF6120 family protein [Clostridium sp. BIOML-A1]MZH16793.1 hypothetical protein [Clostridium sp. BIOML-A1]